MLFDRPWLGFAVVTPLLMVIILIKILNEKKNGKLLALVMRFAYYELGFVGLLQPWLLFFDILLLLDLAVHWGISKFDFTGSDFFSSFSSFSLWHWYQANHVLLGVIFLGLGILLLGLSIWNYHRPIKVYFFTIPSSLVTRPYHILQVTDLQYGTAGPREIVKIKKEIDKILKEFPIDVVANTGDQIDTNNYLPEEIAPISPQGFPSHPDLKFLFVRGNHEFYHGDNKILNALKDQGYKVLIDENQEYQELNFIGFDDSEDKLQVRKKLQENPLVKSGKFNILLYHRPHGVEDAQKAGIHLMLSGHTHKFQIFPYYLLYGFLYPFPIGLVRLSSLSNSNHSEGFTLYTSQGVNIWGPRIRLGSRNELAIFKIVPRNKGNSEFN